MTPTDPKGVAKTRAFLIAFGVLAAVMIGATIALPGFMRTAAVEACSDSGGRYDETTATCVR